MRIRSLLAVLAFVPACFLLPAAAESTVNPAPVATQQKTISAEACLANAKGMKLAQIDCCKGHKGICGCRAGKIVCCDNTVSTEPGCTCHGDEGFTE
jgi:hypothetical protein